MSRPRTSCRVTEAARAMPSSTVTMPPLLITVAASRPARTQAETSNSSCRPVLFFHTRIASLAGHAAVAAATGGAAQAPVRVSGSGCSDTVIAISPTRRSRPSGRPPPEVSGRCCDSDCGMRRVHAMAAKLLFSRLRRRECGHPRPPCGVPRPAPCGVPRSSAGSFSDGGEARIACQTGHEFGP